MKVEGLIQLTLKLIVSMVLFTFLASCSSALLDEGNGTLLNNSYPGVIGTKTTINNSDYATALTKAIQFYDANKCGTGVATGNTFSWRGNCHTGDTMAGGYHDAGDHVKFGLPGSYSFMVLGWALNKYPNAFSASDKTKLRDDILKRFADYYMASYSKTGKTFYYDVGDGVADHAYWGAPENQTGSRTSYQNTYSQGYADIGGFVAAGLALMAMNMQSVNATYAAQCLDYATNLYFDIKGNQKYYIPNSKGYYGCNPDQVGQSLPDGGGTKSIWSTIEIPDKLAMAAAFLYYADTARKSTYAADLYTYLTGNNRGGSAKNQDGWGMSWNDAYPSAYVKAIDVATSENDSTKKTYYETAANWNMTYWKNTVPNTADSGNKMKFLDAWGACRYAASFAMLASIRLGQTTDTDLQTLAKNQVNYILGDNKNNKSYMVGFGSSYPQSPHHRAANPTQASTAVNTITGGMVGGPNQNGDFNDSWSQFQYTEMGLDYNAGLVGALAAMVATYGGGGGSSTASSAPVSSAQASSTPVSSVAASSTPASSAVASSTGSVAAGLTIQTFQSGADTGVNQINGRTKLVNNGSTTITLSTVTVRYYLKNQGVTTLNWACDYTTLGTGNVSGTFANVSPAQTGADQYCVLSFTSGAGSLAPGASAEVQWRVNKTDWSNWDCTINYSYNPSTSYVNWNKVTAYISGTKVWGTEPGGSTSSAASSTPVSSAPVSSTPSSTPVSSAASSTPTAQSIPGKIEAESYNAMSGIQTEACSDTGGTLNIGWIEAGDWMDYNVTVASAGTYTIEFRVAGYNALGAFDLKSGSTTLTTVAVPNSGGWQTYTSVYKTVTLSAGAQTLRIALNAGGFNFNWFKFTAGASSAASSTPVSSTPVSSTPSSTPVSSAVSSQTSQSTTIKLQTKQDGATIQNALYQKITIINTTGSSVALSTLKIRFYLKAPSGSSYNWACDAATCGNGNVNGTIVAMNPVKTGADFYNEITFTSGAGSIGAGASIELQDRIWRSDWANIDSSQNYSYNVSTAYIDWNKVTLYQGSTLIWGVEP